MSKLRRMQLQKQLRDTTYLRIHVNPAWLALAVKRETLTFPGFLGICAHRKVIRSGKLKE